MTQISLYDQYPAALDAIAAAGKPSIREVAKRFARPVDMDRALGLDGLTAHWVAGRNNASAKSEARCREWLLANPLGAPAHKPAHQFAPKPASQPATSMVLVVCAPEVKTQLDKLSRVLGFEMVDV
jgi:hypothetical protein